MRWLMLLADVPKASRANNILAQLPCIKSDDRLNGALGTFINALQDKNNNN